MRLRYDILHTDNNRARQRQRLTHIDLSKVSHLLLLFLQAALQSPSSSN